MFFLINFIISFAIGLVAGVLSGIANTNLSFIGSLYSLAVLVPGIAVGVRRMHDTNRSGWWLLAPIANLIFLATAGDAGENPYGPDPKADEG